MLRINRHRIYDFPIPKVYKPILLKKLKDSVVGEISPDPVLDNPHLFMYTQICFCTGMRNWMNRWNLKVFQLVPELNMDMMERIS